MPNPTIDKLRLPSGNTYDLVDSGARELIAALSGSTKYLGVTTTALSDGSRVNTITVDGQSITATTGDIVIYQKEEFIFDGTKWNAFGDLSTLGKLSTKDHVTVYKGPGDIVLGEDTTFSVSKPAINITGGTTDKVLGSDATFATTVTPARTALRVVQDADGLNSFVRSYPGETSKLETDTVPNVTSAGSASTWAFQMGTGSDATTLIISGANGSAPTLGTAKTVATGSLTSGGSGASVMTGLGSPTVANAVVAVGSATLESSDSNVDAAGYVTVVKGITSASTTADNKDEVTAVTGVGTAALASNPTVTVGTNDKVKVAKYDELVGGDGVIMSTASSYTITFTAASGVTGVTLPDNTAVAVGASFYVETGVVPEYMCKATMGGSDISGTSCIISGAEWVIDIGSVTGDVVITFSNPL